MNFNLHARHVTRPTWTNAVQVKIILPMNGMPTCGGAAAVGSAIHRAHFYTHALIISWILIFHSVAPTLFCSTYWANSPESTAQTAAANSPAPRFQKPFRSCNFTHPAQVPVQFCTHTLILSRFPILHSVAATPKCKKPPEKCDFWSEVPMRPEKCPFRVSPRHP
jgi:hypothetical protein